MSLHTYTASVANLALAHGDYRRYLHLTSSGHQGRRQERGLTAEESEAYERLRRYLSEAEKLEYATIVVAEANKAPGTV